MTFFSHPPPPCRGHPLSIATALHPVGGVAALSWRSKKKRGEHVSTRATDDGTEAR